MIYPFYCKNCKEIELTLKPSQIPLDKCPNCGCRDIERIFSPITSIWRTEGAFSKVNHTKE